MARQAPILIAGAGIGGLTAALALLRAGHEVRVLEQAKQLGEVGAGLQLTPNATRALHLLGLADPLADIAAVPSGKEIRLWSTGQAWRLFDLGDDSLAQYGYPYYMVYRPDLHRILVEAVSAFAPNLIELNARCERFEDRGDSVLLTLADGTTRTGRALVGADGVHSAIRKQLFGDAPAAYSGCMAWRGVIPIERLAHRLTSPVGTNWVGPGRHVIHYPLRGGKLMNFVGIVETDRWVAESWTEKGSHDECHTDFVGWHEDVHTLIQHVDVPYRWALMSRQPLLRWTENVVTLLGDACHPTLPFLTQGAAMAVEDGFLLARAVNESDSIKAALRRYEAARIKRTGDIVRASTEAGKRFHNPELANAEGAAAYVDREWSPERVAQRYEWLFRYRVDGAPL